MITKDSRTVTIYITVSGADYAARTITLPDSEKNSILKITGDETPDVVVNGFDQEAESHPEDSCIITMIVEKVEENNAWIQDQASAIAIIAGGQTVEYLKMEITKTVGGGTPTYLTSLYSVQEIVVPYDFSGKTDITVYRYHYGYAVALRALKARLNINDA